MVNKVTLIGNLGKDPIRQGKAVVFTLATSESYKDNNGEWQKLTEWHNIVLFGKIADYIENKLKKGDTVYLEGKLKTSKYDKNGISTYKTDIIASIVKVVKPKSTASETSSDTASQENSDDDDLPF